MAKVIDKNIKKKQFVVNMTNMEITRVYSITNVLLKYNWYLNFTSNRAVVDLEL